MGITRMLSRLRSSASATAACVGIVTVAGGVAACGGSSTHAGQTGSGTHAAQAANGKTNVIVDIEPNTDSSALMLGAEQGLFKKYGLNVSVQVIPSGATAVANAVSGHVEFAASTYGGLFSLASKGLPLVSIGPGSAGPAAGGKDQNQILALKSSGIQSAKGLDGKKVGVVQLQSVNQAEVQEAVKNAGGNPSTVNFVPLEFGQMGSALQHGEVDAVAVSEPFVTQIDQEMPTVDLGGLDLQIGPKAPLLTALVTKSYYASHKSIVKNFQEGMLASAKYADAHPKAVRAVLPKVAGISSSLAAKVMLPYYPTSVNMPAVNKIEQIMLAFKDIPKSPSISSLLVPFPSAS